jgi:hypothetical protein
MLVVRKQRTRFVYVIGPVDGCHKIGVATYPETRLDQLSLPGNPHVVGAVSSGSATWLERYLHRAFAHRRSRGEWFRLDDSELALILSIPSADSEADLPPAIVALHGQCVKPKKRKESFVTLKVSPEIRRQINTIAQHTGENAPEVLKRVAGTAILAEFRKVVMEG